MSRPRRQRNASAFGLIISIGLGCISITHGEGDHANQFSANLPFELNGLSEDTRRRVEEGMRDFEEDRISSIEDFVMFLGDVMFGFPEGLNTDLMDDLICENFVKPTISCEGLEATMSSLFELTKWNACQMGGSFRPSLARIGQPLREVIQACRPRPEERSDQFPVEFCVEKFNDGSYNGLIGTPPDIDSLMLSGTVNKYGWGADFHQGCGIGASVHSAGGLAVITKEYSLPTLTLRDRSGEIIFEGVYQQTSLNTFNPVPQAGFRAATVVECTESAATVVVSSVQNPVGEFLQFDLDLTSYRGTPVFGIVPTRTTQGVAPSVRKQTLISDDVILYAPLYDTGTPGDTRPTLRLFNWRNGTVSDAKIILQNDQNPFLPFAFVWDFECKDFGLCWVNTLEISDPDPQVLELNEETTGRLSYFFMSEILSTPESDKVIRVREAYTDFDIGYSVLSLEPVSPSINVACTLSGFLFALAQLRFVGVERETFLVDRESRRPRVLGNILETIELGFAQQCNACQGDTFQSNSNIFSRPAPGTSEFRTCNQLEFQGQKDSNVYVWAVEECGGKIFAGTNDISIFFGTILVRALVISLAEVACLAPPLQFAICRGSLSNKCPGTRDGNREICELAIEDNLNRILDVGDLRKQLTALLSGLLFGNVLRADDLGFDLYVIDKDDLFNRRAIFRPVTVNGFAEISTNGDVDEGIRNLVCHTPENPEDGSPKLVITSSVFRDQGQTSNTYVLDLSPKCEEELP